MDDITNDLINKITAAAQGQPNIGADKINELKAAITKLIDNNLGDRAKHHLQNILNAGLDPYEMSKGIGAVIVEATNIVNGQFDQFVTNIKDPKIREKVQGFFPTKNELEQYSREFQAMIGDPQAAVNSLMEKYSSASDSLLHNFEDSDFLEKIRPLDFKAAAIGGAMAGGIDLALQTAPVKALKSLDNFLTGQYQVYREAGTELARALQTPFANADNDTMESFAKANAATFRRTLMEETADLQVEFYADEATARNAIKNILSAFNDLEAQVGDGIRIKVDEKTMLGAASSIKVLADSLNIEASTAAEYISKMTSTWGTGGEVAKESMIDIAKAASAAGYPVSKTFAEISKLNQEFSGMGEMSKGLSATFAQFAQNLGPGKLNQAIGAVNKLASGIGKMSDEMKAFISMGNEALGGGGNAIEAMIRMEEAIASGDQEKFREIQEEIASKIEELSGAALMTREEAVATGQEEKYFLQAKLGEQFGISQDRTQFSAFVQGLRGPAQFGVGDFGGIEGSEANLVERQRELTRDELSASQLAERRIRGVATRGRTAQADVMEVVSGDMKEKISNVEDMNPQVFIDMLRSVLTGPIKSRGFEDMAESTGSASISAENKTNQSQGRAMVSEGFQTTESYGNASLSSNTDVVLSSNKSAISLETLTAVATVEGLKDAVSNLNETLSSRAEPQSIVFGDINISANIDIDKDKLRDGFKKVAIDVLQSARQGRGVGQ